MKELNNINYEIPQALTSTEDFISNSNQYHYLDLNIGRDISEWDLNQAHKSKFGESITNLKKLFCEILEDNFVIDFNMLCERENYSKEDWDYLFSQIHIFEPKLLDYTRPIPSHMIPEIEQYLEAPFDSDLDSLRWGGHPESVSELPNFPFLVIDKSVDSWSHMVHGDDWLRIKLVLNCIQSDVTTEDIKKNAWKHPHCIIDNNKKMVYFETISLDISSEDMGLTWGVGPLYYPSINIHGLKVAMADYMPGGIEPIISEIIERMRHSIYALNSKLSPSFINWLNRNPMEVK